MDFPFGLDVEQRKGYRRLGDPRVVRNPDRNLSELIGAVAAMRSRGVLSSECGNLACRPRGWCDVSELIELKPLGKVTGKRFGPLNAQPHSLRAEEAHVAAPPGD